MPFRGVTLKVCFDYALHNRYAGNRPCLKADLLLPFNYETASYWSVMPLD